MSVLSRLHRHTAPRIVRTGLLLFLIGPVPSVVAAQTIEVRVRAFGGVHDPVGGLPNAHLLAQPDEHPHVRRATHQRHGRPGRGHSAEGPPGRPSRERGAGLRREKTGSWGCADAGGTPLPCPSIIILVPTEIGSTQVSPDVALELPLGQAFVRPIARQPYIRIR